MLFEAVFYLTNTSIYAVIKSIREVLCYPKGGIIMNIREKVLSLEGEAVLVLPANNEEESFLADMGKLDKITDTVTLNVIGVPGENRQEHWPMDRIKDVVLVEE